MNCTCFSKCKDGQSLHSRLFMDLQERIKSACPDIQWCDHWWGQEQFSYRPAVAFPAVLIDMPNTSYSAEGELSQFATATITLRLLFAPFSSSAANAPAASRAEAIRFYDIESRLCAAIHGWTPPGNYCQSLIRISTHTDDRRPEFRTRVITFTTSFEEDFS